MSDRDLRLDEALRRRIWASLGESIEEYLVDVEELPVLPKLDPVKIRKELASVDMETGVGLEEALSRVTGWMRDFQLHIASPRYFGLYNPHPTTAGIVGDALAATFNAQLAAWGHSPFGVEAERFLILELGRKLGMAAGSVDGTFASGGAEANLTATLVALAEKFPGYLETGFGSSGLRPVIYVSAEAHDSMRRSGRVAGIGDAGVSHIPVDETFRMRPDALEEAIRSDRASGRMPAMVVATAGTTNSGVIDPLSGVLEIAKANDLWAHCDAAWGGAAWIVPELRQHLRGLPEYDSITIDAHKWFSVPMGAGVFLTRHVGALERTFSMTPAYMPREGTGLDVRNPFQHSIQWSRRFIGLKFLMTLLSSGWKGYESAIEHQAQMGERLADLLIESGWKLLVRSPLAVVCFTLADRPEDGSGLDEIVRRVGKSGEAWISATMLAGRIPALRACITNFRTEESDLRRLIEVLNLIRAEVTA